MKVGILSRKESLYSTSRLTEEAKNKGHEVEVVDYSKCSVNIASKNPKVLLGDRELTFDAVIPRIGASTTFYGTAVVKQFEMMNTLALNSSLSISRSRDKLKSLQLMAKDGIGMPVTAFSRSPKDAQGMISAVGGAPVIIKLLEGTQGVGVVLAETKKAAESVIAAFRQLDANILVQEYIKESNGSDVRAFVIGDSVVAAIERKASEDEFRSNLHQGGVALQVQLSIEEEAVAIGATKVLGLNVAGVDILRSKRGPLVLEVNSSPGLEGVEKTTGINIAERIIDFLSYKLDNRAEKS